MKEIICPRCAGHGIINKYNHVEGGRCFQCEGIGKIIVEDHVTDIIAELREERKNLKGIDEEFENLWEQHKDNIKIDKDWYNYILCEATETTTRHEERLIRIKQYISYRQKQKAIRSTIDINTIDIDDIIKIDHDLKNKYMVRG